MIRIIIIILLILIIYLYNQKRVENFVNDEPEISKRTKLIVCAYYNLLHEPSVSILDDTYNYEYVLEWRKKTRALGLPYQYDILFYKITDYLIYNNENGITVTYKDVLNAAYPYVKEIYIKNEKNGLVRMLPATETCMESNNYNQDDYNYFLKNNYKIHRININEVVNLGIGLLKVSMADMSMPVIYNANKSTVPKFTPFSITSDRGGNNTPETFP